jgi:hypothetical protein
MGIAFEHLTDDAELDRFVAQNQNGTTFHTSAWKRVLVRQGFRPLYLVARDGTGGMRAVVPFFLSPVSYGLANVALSLPRSDLGGPLLDPDIRPETLSRPLVMAIRTEALLQRILLCTIATDDPDTNSRLLPNSSVVSPGLYAHLNLREAPVQQIWDSSFTRDGRQRNNIRRIESDGVTTRFATESDLPEFYSLYAETISRTGSAPYSFSFMQDMWTSMHPRYFNVLLTIEDGVLVGGSAFFTHPELKRLHMSFGAYALETKTRNAINLFTWWRLLLWAAENGYERIGLGTVSHNSWDPTLRFKRQFGAQVSKKYFVRHHMIPMPMISAMRRVRDVIPA